MLPVVPKVRVGDVLYATRNLRNWLQAASLSVSVVHLGRGTRAGKEVIYSPSKKDKYIVCVNVGLVFSVFVLNRDLVLFFVNPASGEGSKKVSGGNDYPYPGAPTSSEKPKKGSWLERRMSPAIFSTWFVRSSERMPDLRTWPDYAYGTWAALQMNTVSVGGDYKLSVQVPRDPSNLFLSHMKSQNLGNFGSGKRMKDRSTVRACIQHAIKHGMTRRRRQDNYFHTMMMGRGTGPLIGDIGEFRKTLRDSLKNPRIKKHLEELVETTTADALKRILKGIDSKKDF